MLSAECWVLQFQHRLVGGQEQAVAGAARQELDLRIGLTLVRLEKHRQRQRLRNQRRGVGRSLSGRSSFGRSWPARFGGMCRGSKIKRRRPRWRALPPPETQLSSRFPPHFLSSSPTLNVSPNLLPTQGNSDSRSSSDFPISWGENKNGTQKPLRLDALWKRMRTRHQNWD